MGYIIGDIEVSTNIIKSFLNILAADEGSRDDGLPGGQSRISSISHQIIDKDVTSSSDLIRNHNMAELEHHNYRSIAKSGSLPDSSSTNGVGSHYRPSNQFRNFYPAQDVPEPLPTPLARNSTAEAETAS